MPASSLKFSSLQAIINDPTWTRLVMARWSDRHDSGDNLTDVVIETLAGFDPDDADVAAARPTLDLVLRRPGKAALEAAGVATISMGDIAPGMVGRMGWIFVQGRTAFGLILHSAFEDDIPGANLDDSKNAYTELQLRLIRSRRGGTAFYASATRLGRSRRNRLDVTTAMQRYGWACMIGGHKTHLGNELLESVEAGQVEQQSRIFFEATGKGELDDLAAGLYPRNAAGLPFTHRFRIETVTEGDITFEREVAKEVEPAPDVEHILQTLAPMVAAGKSWVEIGRKAQSLDIPTRGAKDVAYGTGRNLASAKWPDTAVKNMFHRFTPLWMTGAITLRWHGKVQGGGKYGAHGEPQHYSTDELLAMPPAKRRVAEKGFFDMTLTWGRPLLPDTTGEKCPYGVPWATWALIEKRLAAEIDAASERRGAGSQRRAKKPLGSTHSWTIGGQAYTVVADRRHLYRLLERPADVRGGWTGSDNRIVAVWAASAEHTALGEALTDLAEDLGDQVAVLTAAGSKTESDSAAERYQRAVNALTETIDGLEARIAAVPAFANELFAAGHTDAARQQYELLPDLKQRLAEARGKLIELEANPPAEQETTAEADFTTLIAAAAGLRAYPELAPCQLADACTALIASRQAQASADRLSVTITCELRIPLTDGRIATRTISYTLPNRARGANSADSDIFEKTARAFFTAKEPVTVAELAEKFGWSTAETARKIRVWLGHRGAVPASAAIRSEPIRIPSKWLRTAILDVPIVELRHAIWAAFMPDEAHIASYLGDGYRRHIATIYSNPSATWGPYWAGDTHTKRRAMLAACMASGTPEAGHTAQDIAIAIGEPPQFIYDSTRPRPASRKKNALVYPATADRADRSAGQPIRILPYRCPHDDCPGRTTGGGWCTLVLRVPELAETAVLCPACMRTPDPTMAAVIFPASYAVPWIGPRGHGAGQPRGHDPNARTLADHGTADTVQ